MSRNFELLRRAGKGQELFIEPIVKKVPACVNQEAVEKKTVQAENNEALWPTPDGMAKKEIIKLVRRVFIFPYPHAARAVSFSSIEGNGSSETCLHAGAALAAQASGSVCLVDANLEAPSLHSFLGVAKFPGLLDAVINPGPIKDYAVQIGRRNLWLIPSGSPPHEVHSLFASNQLRSRITELKKQFDFVLIDAPPASSHTDGILLGQMTDGVILTLEAHSTRREAARLAKENLKSAGVKILGAVLNNRTFPIPDALYRML